ncbi:lipase 1-like [Colias croceus]|uniref:lipase 1-like n=1 Tax=Colias crocea TaxID=72248 RepID=UPI001E27E4B5|nr:lipase 1-like [Colias croceus]
MVTKKSISENTKRIYQMLIINAAISNVTTLDIIPRILTNTGKLSTSEIAAKFGHPAEEHVVTTEDGYMLALHHLPGKGMPILLMHGLPNTSEAWLIRGNTSLGITLAEMGHDIWIGDCRGNKYSRRHVSLDPDIEAEQFWNFTFTEIGNYDLPAFIDYVLQETGYEKLNAIGHSQGTTIFFVMGSMRTEYNDKVNALIALAPIAYLTNVPQPLSTIIAAAPIIYNGAMKLRQYEVFGDSLSGKTIRSLCLKPVIGYSACAFELLFPINGYDAAEYEYSFHYEAFQTFPASNPIKNLYHFAQVSSRDSFSHFDYGKEENLKRYGTELPPDFDLSKVTLPVALISGINDKLSTLEDVAKLRPALPNVIQYTVVERRKCNHNDFIWGRTNYKYLYPLIFNIIEKYFY